MNRGIWIVAVWLVAKHGPQAPYVVNAQIMGLRRELADELLIASWLMVDHAVHELVRTKPGAADTIH
jgi:hypothetical protein